MIITEKFKKYMENPLGNRPLTIAFLGDSVTQGCFELYSTGDNSFETEFRSYEAYHNKLKRMLEEVFPSVPVNIINAGVSGDNAVSGRRRLQRDVIDFGPDLAIVSFGLNDVNEGAGKLFIYCDALEGIFKDLKAAGIETVFMTPNMMGTRVCGEIRDPYVRAAADSMIRHQTEGDMDLYMAKAREVCAANGVVVCDCYAKWKKLEENGADITRLLANRINHPSEKMHWLSAVSLFELIMGL